MILRHRRWRGHWVGKEYIFAGGGGYLLDLLEAL